MIKTKQPEVYLIDTTRSPYSTCEMLIDIMTKDVNPADHILNSAISDKVIEYASEPHGSVFESILTVWILKNVSRAFQQQLTRTRLAGYSCASLRVMNVGCFAIEGRYTMPDGLNEDQQKFFHESMIEIQTRYNHMVNNGYSIEAARGILPLNIHSNVGFIINFQSLRHMISIRLCKTTQSEFRSVAELMKERVKETLGSIFSDLLVAPCEKDKKCRRPKYYCGRWK